MDAAAVGREARLFDHRRGALLQVIEKSHMYADLAWNAENRTTERDLVAAERAARGHIEA